MSSPFSCAEASATSIRSIPSPRWTSIMASRCPGKATFRFSRDIPVPSCAARTSSRSTDNRASKSPSCSRTWRSIVDEIALIRSAVGRSNDHSLSHFEWTTGALLPGSPSYGAWVTYGLGTENQNLPAFVVIFDHSRRAVQRTEQLGRGLSAGGVSRHGVPFGGRSDPRSAAAGRVFTPKEQRARLDLLARSTSSMKNAIPE